MDNSARWQFAVATVFTIASLALLAVSFSTDGWVIVLVNRGSLGAVNNSNPLYFTRNRGLFLTCYEGDPKLFLDNRDDVVDGNCLRQSGYAIPNRDPKTLDYGYNYNVRIHLMRTHVAGFITGLFFYAVAVIISLFGIYKMKFTLLQVTAVIVFVAAFFSAAGMAFFHGYDYIERNKFDASLGGGKGVQDELKVDLESYWKAAYPDLNANALINYGYSYMLGWISVGVGAIAGLLFMASAYNQRDKVVAGRRRDRRIKKKEKALEDQANTFDNMAYNPYGSNMNYPLYDPYSAYAGGSYAPSVYPGAGMYPDATLYSDAGMYPSAVYSAGTYPAIAY